MAAISYLFIRFTIQPIFREDPSSIVIDGNMCHGRLAARAVISMSDTNLNDPSSPPPAPALTPPRPTSEVLVETLLVLLLFVIPHWFHSVAALYLPSRDPDPFVYQCLNWTLTNVGTIGLMFYLIYRSGDPWSRFGIVRLDFTRDVLGGIGLFVLALVFHYLVWIVLPSVLGRSTMTNMGAQNTSYFAKTPGGWGIVLLIVMSAANGLAEELVMRGYLIPRFERLFGSTLLALLLSTILFASYHSYQGATGVISVTSLGIVYGAAFCFFRRLWPIALAHALQDAIGLAMQ